MDNNSNMFQLCRLCLVKDDVNIPIFEEQGDIRQIFLKISSCLPVKVSRDDQLPKKICDGCSYKLDMLYEFWNTSANAEKQLLTWLGEAGMTSQMADGTISAVAQQIKPADAFVKQETIDPPDIHMDDDDDEDKDYMKQEENSTNVEEPPPKRARRTAAVKAAIALDQNSDDDDDSGEPMTKIEDDSEDSDNDDREPAFVDVPSTSADDQPGPSGVGKDGVEAPTIECQSSEGNTFCKIVIVQLECEECPLMFNDDEKFLRHKEYHERERELINCSMCDEPIQRKDYRDHRISQHKAEKHKMKCSVCDKYYSRRLHLRRHYAEQHKEFGIKINVVCELCGFGTYTNGGLLDHMRTHHNEEKIYLCSACPKQFRTKFLLDCHMPVHTGDTPFKCNVCGKQYKHRSGLFYHGRIHKQQYIKCPYCGKQFVAKHNMETHMEVCNSGKKNHYHKKKYGT